MTDADRAIAEFMANGGRVKRVAEGERRLAKFSVDHVLPDNGLRDNAHPGPVNGWRRRFRRSVK